MSLGIAFKGPEGIVLAADSRVTIMAQHVVPGQPPFVVPSTFDNATKLLRIKGQNHVGAVTYGMGAIGQSAPRTAHSFIPEFEAHLAAKHPAPAGLVDEKTRRLSVEEFAKELSSFFGDRWTSSGMPNPLPPGAPEMVFLIGGYDPGKPYGRLFEFSIPTKPNPIEQLSAEGQFGLVWGGQREIVDRLLQGYDQRALDIVAAELKLEPTKVEEVR